MLVNIHEAKTTLSKLIAAAEEGEEVVIARDNTPVVRLVPLAAPAARVAGTLSELLTVTPAFFEPLPPDELGPWETE